jgi:hypothetical protein
MKSQIAASSYIISFFIVSITVVVFGYSSSSFSHWFILPICFCGILMVADAIDWIRGRVDLYDPVGFIGCFGVHFFFIAPLLQVKWNFFDRDLPAPPDWRDWLGYMALLNAIGLAAYTLCRSRVRYRRSADPTVWTPDKKRFSRWFPVFLIVGTGMQLWTYVHFGGIGGYMQAHLDGQFKGMGWIFMISEAVPLLTAFWIIVHFHGRKVTWHRLGMALVGLFVIQMFFGGLRGSRSETVLLLFWVVGCIHFLIRPVPRSVVALGCVCLSRLCMLTVFTKMLV